MKEHMFFIVFTDSCRSGEEGGYLVRRFRVRSAFVNWCDENFLDLNVGKTTTNLQSAPFAVRRLRLLRPTNIWEQLFDSQLKV